MIHSEVGVFYSLCLLPAAAAMFWKFDLHTSSQLEALLEKGDVTLTELMEEEDLLQECKAQNRRLAFNISPCTLFISISISNANKCLLAPLWAPGCWSSCPRTPACKSCCTSSPQSHLLVWKSSNASSESMHTCTYVQSVTGMLQ